MDIIIWILVGALAGWAASLIMKTDQQMGALANIAVGILGAFVGGWIVNMFGTAPAAGELNVFSILTAILGAVVLLFVFKMLRGGTVNR